MYLCNKIDRVSGNSTCTSVILGENKELTEEETRSDTLFNCLHKKYINLKSLL